MSPLPVPPHANSVLAAGHRHRHRHREKRRARTCWRLAISMRAAGSSANALRNVILCASLRIGEPTDCGRLPSVCGDGPGYQAVRRSLDMIGTLPVTQ
jgi:hypothetical protein